MLKKPLENKGVMRTDGKAAMPLRKAVKTSAKPKAGSKARLGKAAKRGR